MIRNRIDIFCRVVDNFGDIGVLWRLSKQLCNEYQFKIRIWVDDLNVAGQLISQLDPKLSQQTIKKIEIHYWSNASNFENTDVANIVIEGFACELPKTYIQKMTLSQPIWLNLEYLSAESWVNDFHAKTSIHPINGLKKTFFFPGFNEHTGGLIREHHLSHHLNSFKQNLASQEAFWQKLKVVPQDNAIKVSLFSYPHAPIQSLFTSMAHSTQPIHCFVPATSILPCVTSYFNKQTLNIGETLVQGQLQVTILPFLNQDDYDQLLWSCDLNFVRGEDSWIRALWASNPFIWQTYPQDEKLHLKKLAAFLTVYNEDASNSSEPILNQFHEAWLDKTIKPDLWQALLLNLPKLKKMAVKQTQKFEKQADLAAKLVVYIKNQV